MTQELAQTLAVVQQGMEMERQGHGFYMQQAARTGDARGKTMFVALAQDELAHLTVLKGQYESLSRTGAWKEWSQTEPAKDRAADAPTLFPRTPVEAQKAVKADAGDLDALRFGISIEDKSYQFYSGLAEKATEAVSRSLFQRLANEEDGHRKLLQDTFDYLDDPEGWFLHQEKPIFEG